MADLGARTGDDEGDLDLDLDRDLDLDGDLALLELLALDLGMMIKL